MERSLEETRSTVTDRTRAMSDDRTAKAARLAQDVRAYKERSARLRDGRRTLRLLETEWQRACDAVDELCDLMAVDRRPLAGLLGDYRRPGPDTMAVYFDLMDRRLNDVLHRLYYVQNKCASWPTGGGDGDGHTDGRQHAVALVTAAEDSVSTGSEQEDDFVTHDLDDPENRHAKMMAVVDPTTVPIDVRLLDIGHVPSPCVVCVCL